MSRRLPSLNALRAFEAAARHLSFTRAADELFVTQAAVSHQIKGLEETLGVPLFRRLNRRLLLTDAGQTLSAPLTEALDLMAAGVARLGEEQREGVLRVSTIESIAATWLVPRLAQFRDSHPEIELSLGITDQVIDFERDRADMAIRYGPGGWPKASADKLADEEIFPVMAPGLLDRGPPLKIPTDLLRYPLIHEDLPETWADWFEAAGAGRVQVPTGTFLPHSNLVMQAVLAGEGVALGRSFLIGPEIAQGRLVRPFAAAVPARNSYWVVIPDGTDQQPKIQAFRDWIITETRRTLALVQPDPAA